MKFLQGKKTYLVSAALLAVVAVEKGAGIDIPGVIVDDNWLFLVLNGLGLSTLRAGVGAK